MFEALSFWISSSRHSAAPWPAKVLQKHVRYESHEITVCHRTFLLFCSLNMTR